MCSSKNTVRMLDKKFNIKECIDDAVLMDICGALQEIRYGSVQLHIQDGKIIQIDKVNKIRMR